jgi:hypothetical protein
MLTEGKLIKLHDSAVKHSRAGAVNYALQQLISQKEFKSDYRSLFGVELNVVR